LVDAMMASRKGGSLGLHDDMTATADALYGAALGQIDWHDALDRVIAVMGFTSCTVYAVDRQVQAAATPDYRLPVTGFWHRHDPVLQRLYESEYYKLEVGRHYRLSRPEIRIDHDLMYARDAELDRTAYYDWADREYDLRYSMAARPHPDAPIGAAIGLQRPRRLGPVEQADVERLACLMEHLQRAVHIEHFVGKALAANVQTADLLDRNPNGIVLLDGFGGVVLANSSARAMAAEADSFTLQSDGLRALRPSDDARLTQLIVAAIRTATGEGLSAGGMLRLPRRSGKRGYVVIVGPLARRESILSELMPRAVAMIYDPERAAPQSPALLRQAYGITAAEARLVQRLTAGDTPEQAAAALGVSVATARAQLASTFRKTETTRQSELIRLLVSLPWWAQGGAESGGG
jgi:DNA-binding CsgD family transcriptional regulator